MFENDDDIKRALGCMTMFSAHLEYEIDCLLLLLKNEEELTKIEQYWGVSKKIEKAKEVASKLNFESRDNLIENLEKAKKAFEERNKMVHGQIYGNQDGTLTLKSCRPNTPNRIISTAEFYKLAERFDDLKGKIYRPTIFEIPRALT